MDTRNSCQHYFMGGIHVDANSKTTMNSLYAVGETSCNGVHGANRWQVILCWKVWFLQSVQRKTLKKMRKKGKTNDVDFDKLYQRSTGVYCKSEGMSGRNV